MWNICQISLLGIYNIFYWSCEEVTLFERFECQKNLLALPAAVTFAIEFSVIRKMVVFQFDFCRRMKTSTNLKGFSLSPKHELQNQVYFAGRFLEFSLDMAFE